jgi:hypothetical protein
MYLLLNQSIHKLVDRHTTGPGINLTMNVMPFFHTPLLCSCTVLQRKRSCLNSKHCLRDATQCQTRNSNPNSITHAMPCYAVPLHTPFSNVCKASLHLKHPAIHFEHPIAYDHWQLWRRPSIQFSSLWLFRRVVVYCAAGLHRILVLFSSSNLSSTADT